MIRIDFKAVYKINIQIVDILLLLNLFILFIIQNFTIAHWSSKFPNRQSFKLSFRRSTVTNYYNISIDNNII